MVLGSHVPKWNGILTKIETQTLHIIITYDECWAPPFYRSPLHWQCNLMSLTCCLRFCLWTLVHNTLDKSLLFYSSVKTQLSSTPLHDTTLGCFLSFEPYFCPSIKTDHNKIKVKGLFWDNATATTKTWVPRLRNGTARVMYN